MGRGERLAVGDVLARWLRSGGLEALDFALGGAPDVIGVVDPQLIVRYINYARADLTRQSVVGGRVLDLAPPEYRHEAEAHYRKVLRTGESSRFEVLYRSGEHVLMFEVRVGPIRVDDEVIGLVTASTEVTEQRRAEADRDRFFSLSLDMLVVIGSGGEFKRVNPAFARALGYETEELVGRHFLQFVHPDDRARTRTSFGGLLGGTEVGDFENRYLRKDGQDRVLSWRGTVDPITGDVYAVARDVTEHRATEMQLRHAQKMDAVGKLAGGVAHDFNNLMQAVLANAELATGRAAEAPYVRERLEAIESAAMRAAALTKQLLAFSRRQPLRRASLELNALVRSLVDMLSCLLPENIAIELIQVRMLPSVSADRTQLEQVIVNLCLNARDAMEHGGQLTIETEDVQIDAAYCETHGWARPGRYVLLRVMDTGVGMPPEVLERVFEPFFTTKGPQHGTGLGLATAYGIVRQHEGMIYVYSGVGQGTTFEVYLPADARPAVDEGSEAVEPRRLPRGDETLLVAEDEPEVRRAVVEILRRSGYHVLAAASGLEAIRMLREHPGPVHLALLDVMMPELDGVQTWEQLRRQRPDLRVVFASGYADGRYKARLPAEAELITKPFRRRELLTRLRAVLDA